jgi:AraC-like DNA-binding protein/quercetin dioxygenase-like cupin family protein
VSKGVGCQAVLPDGQISDQYRAVGDVAAADAVMGDQFCAADGDEPGAVSVVTFPMPAGLVFDWHVHRDHQLAWAASGVLTVRTQASAWVLPPTRALWIPAGLRHETLSAGAAMMRSAYVRPDRFPLDWAQPTPVSASPLLCDLISYLEDRTLTVERRARAEAVLVDLLQPVAMTTIDVRWPTDDRARQVADRLAASPADTRTLAEWGRQTGASERTLARIFVAETGVSFGRWRTLIRIQAALTALASGEPVGNVARRVGYDSDSAFVQAFRRETGVTPATYFRSAS